jgi:small subunit ribosomal protein S17e
LHVYYLNIIIDIYIEIFRVFIDNNHKDKIVKFLYINSMDRVKRLSIQLLENYPDRFSTNFEENKKTILSLAIIRSKILRNKMAGYITSKLTREADQEKSHSDSSESQMEES